MTDKTEMLLLKGLKATEVQETAHQFLIEIGIAEKIDPNPCCFKVLEKGWGKNGTRRRRYRDIPLHGKYVELELKLQKFSCNECKRYAEEDPSLIEGLHEKREMTQRAYNYIGRSAVHRTCADVSRDFGLPESTVRDVFDEYSNEELKKADFSTPEILGIDEKRLYGRYACIIGNIEKRTLVNILKTREKDMLTAYFKEMPDKEKVRVFCQDMYPNYREMAATYFPKAAIVVDRYHVLKNITEIVDEIRKTEGRGLHPNDRRSLSHASDLLLLRHYGKTKGVSLDDRDMLREWLSRLPRLKMAYEVKERFANIFQEKNSIAEAKAAYSDWVRSIPPELEDDFTKFNEMVERWKEPIFAYFGHRYTNAYVEGVNRTIGLFQQLGAGYSFERIRAKALLSQTTHKLESVPKFIRQNWGDLSRTRFATAMGGDDTESATQARNCGSLIDRLIDILETPGAFDALDPFQTPTFALGQWLTAR